MIFQELLIELGLSILSASLYILTWSLTNAELPKNISKIVFISFIFNCACRDCVTLEGKWLDYIISEELLCIFSTLLGAMEIRINIDNLSVIQSIYANPRKARISIFNNFSFYFLIVLSSLGIAGVKYIYHSYGIIDMNNVANVFMTGNKFNIVQFRGIILEYFTKFGCKCLITSILLCYILNKYFPILIKCNLCECKTKFEVGVLYFAAIYAISLFSMTLYIYKPENFQIQISCKKIMSFQKVWLTLTIQNVILY